MNIMIIISIILGGIALLNFIAAIRGEGLECIHFFSVSAISGAALALIWIGYLISRVKITISF